MKNSKWIRLGLAVCLLAMLFIFQGTMSHDTSACWLCLPAAMSASISGFIEVRNNTPYNITVSFTGPTPAGPYKITGNPSYLRKMLEIGSYRVIVSVCNLFDQTPVPYRGYAVEVKGDMTTTVLTVVTPDGYFPVP
ncbi:MAG TPA: hypothetical protein VLQ89_01460 [Candidatus Binatia bacterium]|nr:hypothetical protein [Candidatus Binatia bacterium]